ncbi:hypothetical protein IQ238_19255 [Pleurocapsales cyanobacterium LEGE 06147]|nr:hypothetical protein [Pleurocapsales cyanobacterium LEGE 06147]
MTLQNGLYKLQLFELKLISDRANFIAGVTESERPSVVAMDPSGARTGV